MKRLIKYTFYSLIFLIALAAGALERLYRKGEDWTKLRAHLDRARACASGERAVELHCAYAEAR